MYKIALLDDNQEICELMGYFLSNYFDVATFTNTTSFLKKIEVDRYALAMIDLSIQPYYEDINIQDGCELIEYLKKTLQEPPLLILFTGWISRNPASEGKKLCPLADGFLAKDGDIEEMLQEINRLLPSKVSQN